MKSPDKVLADIRRRVDNTWAANVAGDPEGWPHRFPIGSLQQTDLESGWESVFALIRAWRDWARDQPVTLLTERRKVFTTVQDVPSHVAVASIDDAAALAGTPWLATLERGRRRADILAARFPGLDGLSRVVSATAGYTDTDFDLLLSAADWFGRNDATGLTPRQVPVPGLHAKWLNSHHRQILAITGKDTLGLLPPHPFRVHLTYLDSGHLAAGGRRHDCATIGDTFSPAYNPQIVLICENKDTAIHFPPMPGAIAVEGEGFGGKAAAQLPWITGAASLLYWGDIDAAGFEILNGFRADGVPAASILMDAATYERYEDFGTNTDRKNRALVPSEPKVLPYLSAAENEMYRRLVAPGHLGHRRVEQERIPLDVALRAVVSAVGLSPGPMPRGPQGPGRSA